MFRRLTILLTGIYPAGGYAHSQYLDTDHPWLAWNLDLWITLPLTLTLVVYFRGVRKRTRQRKRVSLWRTTAFLAGTLCFFIALQSPLELLSDHFLFIHQIEHLLLRVFGPLLTILAMPLAPLIQGLPAGLRHHLLTPLVRNRIIQTLYAFLSHPLIAPLGFLATLVIWQIPSLHDHAVQDPLLHDIMHLSMILSGFFFWWLIADPRKNARLPLGLRLIALWLVTIPNSLLGAFITLHKFPLYHVYDVLEGHWGIDRLLDQQLGGLLIWAPGAMMAIAGTGVILLLWIRSDKTASRHPGTGIPAT